MYDGGADGVRGSVREQFQVILHAAYYRNNMAIQLSKFEHEIPEPLVRQQGRKYFRLGLVKRCSDENGEVEAVVEDSERYNISMTVDAEGMIHAHRCTCSYDLGVFCPHEAAVLYYLRDKRKNIRHQQQVTDIIAQMKASISNND